MKPTLHASAGSHHSRRVTILIHELGLDVDVRSIDVRPPGMGGQNQSEEFLRINPNGKVPVLHDGDLVLWESSAIMWYLADKYGPTPLWPTDPARRAEVAKWHLWQAGHLSPAADNLMYEAIVRPMLGEASNPDTLASLTTSFNRWCAVLDAALVKSAYLANGTFSTADIAVATALIYAPVARMPLEGYPNLNAWLARVHERPSWKATEPPPMNKPR